MTRHTPCFFTLGERNFFERPFTRTLKTSYGCGGYTLTGRETGSDKPGRAKTICQGFYLKHTPSDPVRGGDAPWWGGLR